MTMMMMMANMIIITNISYKRFFTGNYAVFYNALSNYDWPSLCNETSVEAAAAVDRLVG
jgi:hypothetical protein